MACLVELTLMVLLLVLGGQAQIQVPPDAPPEAEPFGTDDPCAVELGVPSPSDNLSCEFVVPGGTRCYPREELCNGDMAVDGATPFNRICFTGSDEGANIAALDCKRAIKLNAQLHTTEISFITPKTGTGTRTGTNVPTFECTSGENVDISLLCDGNSDCGAGDDETTPLCESEPLLIVHKLV